MAVYIEPWYVCICAYDEIGPWEREIKNYYYEDTKEKAPCIYFSFTSIANPARRKMEFIYFNVSSLPSTRTHTHIHRERE
jgi:hypothetical protein